MDLALKAFFYFILHVSLFAHIGNIFIHASINATLQTSFYTGSIMVGLCRYSWIVGDRSAGIVSGLGSD
jgi:hypothetical protein